MLYWTIIFPKHLADLNLMELFLNTILLVFLSSVVLITLLLLFQIMEIEFQKVNF